MSIVSDLKEHSHQSYEIWAQFSRHYLWVASAIPLVGLYEVYTLSSCFNSVPLRVVMAAPLVFVHFIVPSWEPTQRNAHIIWACSLCFILPFGFGAILAQSAACLPEQNQLDNFFVAEYLCALFLLIQLSGSVQLSLTLWSVGTISAASTLLFVESPNLKAVKAVTVDYAMVYATILVVGSLAAQTNRIMEQARATIGQMIGAHIAHELRTPLASIRIIASGSLSHLKTLVSGYRAAADQGLVKSEMRELQETGLSNALDLLQAEVDYSNTLIDILLFNTSVSTTSNHLWSTFNASECVNEAVARFPYANQKERSIVDIEVDSDFDVIAPRVLVVHVLLNLIKNAVYYAQKSKDPRIKIKVGSRGGNGRHIFVTDNGPGISKTELRFIFNRYYTTTAAGEGAGVGLSFCKMVMSNIGGTINCRSKPHVSTQFTLTFPARQKRNALNTR